MQEALKRSEKTRDSLDPTTVRTINELSVDEDTSGDLDGALEDGSVELVCVDFGHC